MVARHAAEIGDIAERERAIEIAFDHPEGFVGQRHGGAGSFYPVP
jgi:hypothetical protein